jgi:predicted secreted protein
MSIVSIIAIYFVLWWIVLFAILPFGVRSSAEAGVDVIEGHDAGAPVAPLLLKKVIATTFVSAIIFALFYWLVTSGNLNLDDLPIYKSLPSAG